MTTAAPPSVDATQSASPSLFGVLAHTPGELVIGGGLPGTPVAEDGVLAELTFSRKTAFI